MRYLCIASYILLASIYRWTSRSTHSRHRRMACRWSARWRNIPEPRDGRQTTTQDLFYCSATVPDFVGQMKGQPWILICWLCSAAKETWEATIYELYEMDTGRENLPIIREIWALDCQSHGEAAILNEDVLVRNPGILSERHFHFNSRQFFN